MSIKRSLMKSFKEYLSETYVYHRSNDSNHESIKKNGLTSKTATAANGKVFKPHINFASSKEDTDGYADGPSKLYRVKRSALKNSGKDPFSGYVRTDQDVHPSHIEYLHGSKWKKLSK